MRKQYGIVFLMALFFDTGAIGDVLKKDEKVIVKEKAQKKKTKKVKSVQKKQTITVYQLAKNISIAINFLIKHKDEMTDLEPLLRKRRDMSVNLYRAEAYCVLAMADACFFAKKGQDLSALMNWNNLDPFLHEDVYSEGIKKFINLNTDYNNDSYYKATQIELARDKAREVIHENIFSMIDAINKISDLLPGRFHYSGHVYENIALLDHIAIYEALAGSKKASLSSFDTCYYEWQVAFYRNIQLLLKFIAKDIEKAGMGLHRALGQDDRNTLLDIARREIGDDNTALPSGTCAEDKKTF